jgi:hypothetical protein
MGPSELQSRFKAETFGIMRNPLAGLSVFLAVLTMALAGLAPARAQGPAGPFCVFQDKTEIAGKIFDKYFVQRCDGRIPSLHVVPGGSSVSLDVALGVLAALNATVDPPVWCVGRRRNPPIEEATVAREDRTADFGMQGDGAGANVWNWTCGLTYTGANAMAAAIRSAPENQARAWCVMWRRFITPAGTIFDVFRVPETNITPGIAFGYAEIRCRLTDSEAVALETSLEAGNPSPATASLPGQGGPPSGSGGNSNAQRPPVWCVVERGIEFGGQTVRQAAAIMCADLERAGPGWTITDGPAPVHRAIRNAERINRQSVATATAASCRGAMAGSVPTPRAPDGSYQCVCPAGTAQTGAGCNQRTAQQSPPPVPRVSPVPPAPPAPQEKKTAAAPEQKASPPAPPPAATLAMSGPAWVQKSWKNGNDTNSDSADYSATSVRVATVRGAWRRDIQWTFSPPPASLSPGQEFTITITGSLKQSDKGAAVAWTGTPPTATVSAKGLTRVKGEHAWGTPGDMHNGTYVFKVPSDAKGATIIFGADFNSGNIAAYHYGDHKQ